MDNKTVETIMFTNDYELLQMVLHGLKMYYIPFLVYLGSLGNCVSVCVFFGTKMRRTSSNFYLAALAISDTGFLLSLFIAWLGMVDVTLFNRQGFCQFFIYLTSVCSFLSAWFVVSFTIERFVAVRYPLQRKWMCTVKRAKKIIFSITSIGLIICSPVLLFSKPQATNSFSNSTVCMLADEWQKWASAYNMIDTVLTFVVPFCLIVILNTLIVKSVWRIVRVRKTLTIESGQQQQQQQQHRDKSNSSHAPRSPISQTKVTKMLLIVSSVFLCFNLPDYVIRIYSYFLTQRNEEPHVNIIIAQQLSNILFNTNFGINFVLYCATGQNFRAMVVRILCHRCQRTNNKALSSTQRSSQKNLYVADSDRSGGSAHHKRTNTISSQWTDNYEMQAF